MSLNNLAATSTLRGRSARSAKRPGDELDHQPLRSIGCGQRALRGAPATRWATSHYDRLAAASFE